MVANKIGKFNKAIDCLVKDKKYAKKAKKNDFGYKNPIWLISERGSDALDNGYHLYKYLVEHPELGITPIYVIDASSNKDLKKIISLHSEVVLKGSAKHYMLMHKAEALISTHAYGFTPDKDIFYHLAQKGLFKPEGVTIFLSHGVTDKDAKWLYRENFKPDMFITSCLNEYDLISKKFKQPKDVVVKTGMPRYDALYNATKPLKQILIMPTWRLWLNNLNDEEFKQSEYYTCWSSFLNNKALKEILRKHGYKLVFYLHPELKKRKHLFTFKGITVEDDDIQNLMIESEILITDYSSVFYDMAYMDRKIVFYQFDKDKYTNEHYEGVITDYKKFGTIIDSLDDVADVINKVIIKPNVIDKRFIDECFFNHDDENCQRTVEEIKKRIKKIKGEI